MCENVSESSKIFRSHLFPLDLKFELVYPSSGMKLPAKEMLSSYKYLVVAHVHHCYNYTVVDPVLRCTEARHGKGTKSVTPDARRDKLCIKFAKKTAEKNIKHKNRLKPKQKVYTRQVDSNYCSTTC